MRLNIRDIMFVRKDKTLFSNKYKTIMEESKTGYVYNDNAEGVAIIPYRMGANGNEILIRDEYSPLHDTVLSIITGRKDADDKGWRDTARRELLEEAGILAEERWFTEVGEILPAGSYKRPDMMCIIDVTGVHQGKPITDGSLFEKKSTNMWVPVSDLVRMVRQPNGLPDAYFLAAITKYLTWCGMIGKSEESDLEKGKKGSEKPGHKYIRRKPKKTGQGYDYIYKEPEAKGPKKEEGKKKLTLVEQLAALVGKKQGGEEEKKPKKQLPWDEFNNVPLDMPDFRKGMTAAQWSAELDRMVIQATGGFVADLDDADYDMMNDGTRINNFYIDVGLKMLEAAQNAYSTFPSMRNDIIVENNKLDDRAQNEVKNAILSASYSLCVIKHLNTSFSSSIFENIYDNFAKKMNGGKWWDKDYSKLDRLSSVISVTKISLERLNEMMLNMQWLQGSDPKLDWMVDQVFEANKELMKSRDRFAKNGLKFFIDQMTPKLESLKDAEEISSSLKMMEQFETFRHDVLHSSTTAGFLGVFANQWNMKQKGVYDGASRFSAYATGKIVDKIKSLESLGDDDIIKKYINDLGNNDAFSFLTMSLSNEPFRMSEQVFSYIDMHGMDKYYQDMVFLTGGRPGGKSSVMGDHYRDCIATLTKAYNGEDVYHDDDALFQSEKWGGGIGNMKKGKYTALYAAMNTMILLNKNAPIESKVPAFIRMWSSASHNSLMSNAVEAFVDAKGIDRGSYVNYHVASNRTIIPRRAATNEALEDTINKIYDNTQKAFTTKGSVTLYRGNGNAEVKSTASSWTPRDHIAINFGHIVSKVEAPSEAILLSFNEESEDYWSYPEERECVLVPGLLSADKKLQPEPLLGDQRQAIFDKELEKQAEEYEKY